LYDVLFITLQLDAVSRWIPPVFTSQFTMLQFFIAGYRLIATPIEWFVKAQFETSLKDVAMNTPFLLLAKTQESTLLLYDKSRMIMP